MSRPIRELSKEEKEEIKDMYLGTDFNIKEISIKTKVSCSKISKLLKELGTPKKRSKAYGIKIPSRRKEVDLNKVKELREELYSYRQISKILMIGEETLKKIIKEDESYEECKLGANEKLAGKIKEIINKYKETESIVLTSKYFNCHATVIRKILKYKKIEIKDTKRKGFQKGHKINKTHGYSNTELYNLYKGIKDRCFNAQAEQYRNYGGRGIKMYKAWAENPEFFIKYIEEHLGVRPTKNHSLDRIDNNKDYEPENLRWATPKQQSRNKRTNVLNEEKAKQLRDAHISKRPAGAPSVKQLAFEYGIDYSHAKKVSRGEIWD